jgi:hypothetical protein
LEEEKGRTKEVKQAAMRKIMKRVLLNEVLSHEPDKPLYHYTTQRGILGIIGAKELWVTHTQYLNDRREFRHAVDLTSAEIKRLMKTYAADSVEARSLTEMENALQWRQKALMFVFARFPRTGTRFHNGEPTAQGRLVLLLVFQPIS